MKIQYKYQKFQADAARAVVDVFAGQPYKRTSYLMDTGRRPLQQGLRLFSDDTDGDQQPDYISDRLAPIGWSNYPIVPELTGERILANLNRVQIGNQIKPSAKLEGLEDGCFNLTVEMETGVGKTYTYIKTMYELNKAYGWSKFIVIVPSVAIREGVYKSFQMTEEHFAQEYGKKIRFFIYKSSQLSEVQHFAQNDTINVMIINSQAFNAKGKDARRIYMALDEFQSRRPIDVIAKTNPVLIIDEPQSVEGPQTKERLREFHPILTLRYSATHKADRIYNMVYRLDAMDAYNQRLVKKIAVKGISATGTTSTNSYLYLESINLSKDAPTATIQFEVKQKEGTKIKSRICREGDNLYEQSGELEEYKDGFTISSIRGDHGYVEFLNGLKLCPGDVVGDVNQDQMRSIQIRETIISHIQRERELFRQGIKVLSLFFIDEVANYREYDEEGRPVNGKYAQMFEEQYNDYVHNMLQLYFGEEEYSEYLDSIDASKTHAGYFSIDGKGKMTNGKINKKEQTSDDVSAYDLIMKNKELLLDRDPQRSPVRFIFSHSALREGWDNPNVFQICTLKQSGSEVRKRQEVGRGLRLCVDQNGRRMDSNILGNEVHNTNLLTVIASESYDNFAKALQTEMAEAIGDRPRKVNEKLFEDEIITDDKGNEKTIDKKLAKTIVYGLIAEKYVDTNDMLTQKYHADRDADKVVLPEEVKGYEKSVLDLIDKVYDPNAALPEDARGNNLEIRVDEKKLKSAEFKALWSKIHARSIYAVDFDSKELIGKAVKSLNENLRVSKIFIRIETGTMNSIESKEDLEAGKSFEKQESKSQTVRAEVNPGVKYDLVGKIAEKTGLIRKDVIAILTGINELVLGQFKENPEEFILKASALINVEKATVIIDHITYNALDEENSYGTDIFTDHTVKGKLGRTIQTKKHLYDHVVFDSEVEKKFATELDSSTDVMVYVKLPGKFYIPTPVGDYNPDWAIAFREGNIKHIYFIAETKGSMDTMDLRPLEKAKIQCAEKHFKAISKGNVKYGVVKDYADLLQKVMM